MSRTNVSQRKLQGMRTRQKIFDTALALFTTRGYEKVTIDEICEKVGVSKGAFYNHFQSKDRIIVEHFMKLDEYYDEISKAIATLKSSIEKLQALQHYVLDNLSKVGILIAKMAYHAEIGPRKGTSVIISNNRSLNKLLKAIVEEGQQRGEIRRELSTSVITKGLLQMYRGVVFEWCLNNGKHDIVKAGEELLPIILSGIIPPSGESMPTAR
jgi:AcrR family transcriptional regulator